jgi:hypothetical protein
LSSIRNIGFQRRVGIGDDDGVSAESVLLYKLRIRIGEGEDCVGVRCVTLLLVSEEGLCSSDAVLRGMVECSNVQVTKSC